MLKRLLTQNCTLITMAQTEELDENDMPSFSQTRTDLPCRYEQVGATEDTNQRNLQVDDLRIFFAPGVRISGRDKVEIGSGTYEVIGDGLLQVTPRGPSHIVAFLRRSEG